MEAISSANDFFHQPKFSQVSPKLSSKMPSSTFGGLQFLIRQRKSLLSWQLSFVGSSYFANMITILFQLLFLSGQYVHVPPYSLENHTRIQTTIGKVYTRFRTKTVQKPYPWGRHIGYNANITAYPPGEGGGADTVQVVALKIKLTHVSAKVRRRGIF